MSSFGHSESLTFDSQNNLNTLISDSDTSEKCQIALTLPVFFISAVAILPL